LNCVSTPHSSLPKRGQWAIWTPPQAKVFESLRTLYLTTTNPLTARKPENRNDSTCDTGAGCSSSKAGQLGASLATNSRRCFNLVDTQRWHVQFVMPGKYTLESLPLPNNDAKTLRKVSVKLWKRRRIQDSTQTAVFTKKPRQLPNGCKIANWFLKLNLRMHEDIGVQSLPNQWTDRYQLSFSAHGARSDARG